MDEKEFESEYYTLTDEDGNEIRFELLAAAEIEGVEYWAMLPVDDQPEDSEIYEYSIFRIEEEEDGDLSLVPIDDDDEGESIAEYFDDLLSGEVDYDVPAEGESEE